MKNFIFDSVQIGLQTLQKDIFSNKHTLVQDVEIPFGQTCLIKRINPAKNQFIICDQEYQIKCYFLGQNAREKLNFLVKENDSNMLQLLGQTLEIQKGCISIKPRSQLITEEDKKSQDGPLRIRMFIHEFTQREQAKGGVQLPPKMSVIDKEIGMRARLDHIRVLSQRSRLTKQFEEVMVPFGKFTCEDNQMPKRSQSDQNTIVLQGIEQKQNNTPIPINLVELLVELGVNLDQINTYYSEMVNDPQHKTLSQEDKSNNQVPTQVVQTFDDEFEALFREPNSKKLPIPKAPTVGNQFFNEYKQKRPADAVNTLVVDPSQVCSQNDVKLPVEQPKKPLTVLQKAAIERQERQRKKQEQEDLQKLELEKQQISSEQKQTQLLQTGDQCEQYLNWFKANFEESQSQQVPLQKEQTSEVEALLKVTPPIIKNERKRNKNQFDKDQEKDVSNSSAKPKPTAPKRKYKKGFI